ncbi:MAG TPA: hypothetical protein VGK73_12735 [Polyangiaceae bacterium]
MPRLCLIVALASACAPATDGLAVRAPDDARERAAVPGPDAPRPRRLARLAPPFASSPSTRRVDDGATRELELAAAH